MTDNKNLLGKSKSKNVFMSSIIGTKTKTQKITNTPKNMFINQVSKLNNENENEKTDTETETDTESDTDSIISSDEQNKNIINRKNINITNLDGGDKEDKEDKEIDDDEKEDNEIEEIEEIDDDDVDINNEEQTEDDSEDNKPKGKKTEYNTEYNDESISEKNNNLDNCIYQYDDLVEDKYIDIKPYEVPRQERMTDPQMTHYEKIRILGIRTKQISMGSKVMVKYNNSINPVELAKFELLYKTTPLLIKRPLPDGSYEIWKVSDFEDDVPIIQNLEKSYNDNKQNLYLIETI